MNARLRRWFGPALLFVALGCSVVLLAWVLASGMSDTVGVVAAMAFFVLLGGSLAAGVFVSLMAAREQRRMQQGQCTRCGYDLRGSREFGRCPECGEPVPPVATSRDDGEPAEWTPMALRVLARARAEAERAGQDYVGTEHLLLALTSEPEGVAAHVLVELGVTEADLRSTIEVALGAAADEVGQGDPNGPAPGRG